MKMPVLLSSREVLHKNVFDSGPRVSQIDTIQMPDDSLVEVSIWTQNGKVVKVGQPVTIKNVARLAC
jgi:hypothetical protein